MKQTRIKIQFRILCVPHIHVPQDRSRDIPKLNSALTKQPNHLPRKCEIQLRQIEDELKPKLSYRKTEMNQLTNNYKFDAGVIQFAEIHRSHDCICFFYSDS